MSEVEETGEEPQKKKSKLPIILGLVLAIAGGGGGFFAVQSGMLFSSESHEETAQHDVEEHDTGSMDVAFVPVDPLVISLGAGSNSSHLRFSAQLEVDIAHKEEIEKLMPRVVDVLNGYLRALDPAILENSSILARLRSQMLRRIQIVAGAGRVSDLLIMEFVLN